MYSKEGIPIPIVEHFARRLFSVDSEAELFVCKTEMGLLYDDEVIDQEKEELTLRRDYILYDAAQILLAGDRTVITDSAEKLIGEILNDGAVSRETYCEFMAKTGIARYMLEKGSQN